MSLTESIVRSGPDPQWSKSDWSGPDPVQQFRERLCVHLQKRLRKGESIDTTEARSILALAAQILGSMK